MYLCMGRSLPTVGQTPCCFVSVDHCLPCVTLHVSLYGSITAFGVSDSMYLCMGRSLPTVGQTPCCFVWVDHCLQCVRLHVSLYGSIPAYGKSDSVLLCTGGSLPTVCQTACIFVRVDHCLQWVRFHVSLYGSITAYVTFLLRSPSVLSAQCQATSRIKRRAETSLVPTSSQVSQLVSWYFEPSQPLGGYIRAEYNF